MPREHIERLKHTMSRDTGSGIRYTLGGGQGEQTRLHTQAEGLREHTRALLDTVDVKPGFSALDLGCGPGGAIEILSEFVGAGGHVVGVDLDAQNVKSARALARRRGLTNVEILRADARGTGLPRSSFDLVHVRLLLVNIAAPEQVVDEMARLVKPGGWVAVMEPDVALRVCYPSHSGLERLTEVLAAGYRRVGADINFGRRLPHLLAQAGLEKITAQARAELCPPGHRQRAVCLDLVQNMRARILNWGLIEEAELDRLDQEARAHLDDPDTVSLPVTYFVASARKPTWAA